MVELEFQQKTKTLIDSLKSICANYGLGNDGNEFKIITQTFLYKFLNDKFAFEAKKLDDNIAKADKWEEALAAMSEDDLDMLQLQMGGNTARLKPQHFISYLFSQQNAPDFAKLFDGLRHDSGDPYEWGDKAYAHYKKLKIDSKTKMLTFSDGLNLEKAWSLHQYFKDRFQVSFGIGTNLTNDLGQTPLNIVLKLVECNGQSVAKISDSPGKTMTDNDTFLAYLRQVFNLSETE